MYEYVYNKQGIKPTHIQYNWLISPAGKCRH